jgi:hypothetical protein
VDVIGFLYTSLGSSTVQVHDSLASRRECVCSEVGFSKMCPCLRGTTEEQHTLVRCLWAKGLSAKDIHKEMFPVCGGKVCA